jgi:hypothetical protein
VSHSDPFSIGFQPVSNRFSIGNVPDRRSDLIGINNRSGCPLISPLLPTCPLELSHRSRLPPMPAKPPHVLTNVEKRLLRSAAVLHAAVKAVAEFPPSLKWQAFLNAKVKAEIVSTYVICCAVLIEFS